MTKRERLIGTLDNRRSMYCCIGENWVEGVRFGYCGKCYTLKKWIEELWGERAEEAIEHFDGDSDKNIVAYIRQYRGKTLVKIKKVR